MAGMASVAVSVRTAILNELRKKEYRAIDLLQILGNEGYSDSDIKQALSHLLTERCIELTPQRLLKPSASQDAA